MESNDKNITDTRSYKINWWVYASTIVVWSTFWWWIQISYYYDQNSRLTATALNGIWTVIFTVLMSIVSDINKITTENPGLRKWALMILKPFLNSNFGLILPITLTIITFYLYFDYRCVRLKVDMFSGLSENEHPSYRAYINSRDISSKLQNNGTFIVSLNSSDQKLIVTSDFYFFPDTCDLNDAFSISDYLLDRKTDPSGYLKLDKIEQPIKVIIKYPGKPDGVTGQINPSSDAFVNLKLPDGTSFKDFLRSISDSVRAKRETPIIIRNLNDYFIEFNPERRSIVATHVDMLNYSGMPSQELKAIVELCKKIIQEGSQDEVDLFRRILTRLKANVNVVIEETSNRMSEQDFRYDGSPARQIGFGRFVRVLTENTYYINQNNADKLFEMTRPFLNAKAGANSLINPTIAMMRLTKVSATKFQKALYDTLANIFASRGIQEANDIREYFLIEANSVGLCESLISKETIEAFLLCLARVGEYGDANAKSRIRVLLEKQQQWKRIQKYVDFRKIIESSWDGLYEALEGRKKS